MTLQYIILIEDSQEFSETIDIDLSSELFEQHLQTKIDSFYQMIGGDSISVDFQLGIGLNQLIRRKWKQSFYKDIRAKIAQVFQYIKSINIQQQITTIKYSNKDFELDVEDIVFDFFKDLINLQNLIIKHEKGLSSKQFNQLLQNITTNRSSYEKLQFQFGLTDESQKIQKFKKIETIECLYINGFTSIFQLKVFQLAKEIKKVEIFNSLTTTLKMEQISNDLVHIKNSLKSLTFNLFNYSLITQECIKSLEKLSGLEILSISGNNLQKSMLNIEKLKNLKSIVFKFSNSIQYLLELQNLPQLEYIDLQIGNFIIDSIDITKFRYLKQLFFKVEGRNRDVIKCTISCLESFSQLYHQLKELEIDFSSCAYFEKTIMNSDLIKSLGDVFQKCNLQANINVLTKNCLFDVNRRFELASQIIKIKNFQFFLLNGECVYETVSQLIRDQGYLTPVNVDPKCYPYYLTMASICPVLSQSVIYIALNEKFNNVYHKFKHFGIRFPHYQKQEQPKIIKSLQILSQLPNDVIYLEFLHRFTFKLLKEVQRYFKNLRIIKFSYILFEDVFDMNTEEIRNIYNHNLHLIIQSQETYSYHEKYYQQLFNLKDYILQFTIESQFKMEDLLELFEMVINKNNIIFFYLQKQIDQNNEQIEDGINQINNYCFEIQGEISKIICYNQNLTEALKINPKMVYLDLMIDCEDNQFLFFIIIFVFIFHVQQNTFIF